MEHEFIQTINAHAGIVHSVCRLYSRELEDRKDLYQEIVLQLWRGFSTFRGESKASTWIYRIALNTAISLVRRRSRQIVSTTADGELLATSQLIDPPPDNEPMQQFYEALEQLSPVEKAVIFLYLDDNSYEQIATVLGISVSNVGVKLNRIKAKLKKIVAEDNL
ncbi:RNA polymerase sigma factor [Spirosoma sp. SC4-14]|uniref:RNA polymerase sigma factor n=1 Tax=Spirosoma sp. SC4-14 TaxID=3128900 RepID=UPI0030D14681